MQKLFTRIYYFILVSVLLCPLLLFTCLFDPKVFVLVCASIFDTEAKKRMFLSLTSWGKYAAPKADKELTITQFTGQSLEYGRYLVVRKDGKKHLETYNGTGWAYNHKVIEYFYLPKID